MKKIFSLSILLLLFSCSVKYQSVNHDNLAYQSTNGTDLEFSYKHNVLTKKYRQRQFNKGVYLIAVEIKNNTDKSCKIGNNAFLFDKDNNKIELLDSNTAYRSLRQRSGSFLYTGFLIPIGVLASTSNDRYIGDAYESMATTGIIMGAIYVVGSVYSIAKGSEHNKLFLNDLNDLNLLGQEILPSESKKGILVYKSRMKQDLRIIFDD